MDRDFGKWQRATLDRGEDIVSEALTEALSELAADKQNPPTKPTGGPSP